MGWEMRFANNIAYVYEEAETYGSGFTPAMGTICILRWVGSIAARPRLSHLGYSIYILV
jgi:hypothetical protein